MLTIPLLGPLGYYLHAWWLSAGAVFILVPLGDLVVGEDRSNDSAQEDRWIWYFWSIPHLYLLVWLGCLIWTALTLREAHGFFTSLGLLLAAGISSGFVTCAAHELLHRGRAADFWAARVAMAICCYGHFVVEHLHHHATAGRPECGTVPKRGETMGGFVIRNAVFGFKNAYRVAERIRGKSGKAWLRNRVVQQHCLSAAFACLAGFFFGLDGLVVFAAQAVTAIFTVEFVQYCEHYGLSRCGDEPMGPQHSWNANGWVTNSVTLNIARHSTHHLDASIPYQALGHLASAPQAPLGYFGMFWVSLLPAVWAEVVHPLLPSAATGDAATKAAAR